MLPTPRPKAEAIESFRDDDTLTRVGMCGRSCSARMPVCEAFRGHGSGRQSTLANAPPGVP